MNRTQFWVLNGASALAVILLLTHIFFLFSTANAQTKLAYAQQFVQAGENWDHQVRELAVSIYQLGQTDPALKDILVKEGITINPNSNGSSAPAPAPANP